MATPEEIFKGALEKIAAQENLTTYDLDIKPASSGGANFMSILYKATISSPNRPDIKLFAKLGVLPDALRQQIPVEMSYQIEATLYTKIVPSFEKLQEKYEIPVEERFKFPKYYHSDLELNQEIIVLEDLIAQGYTMYERFNTVNWEYASKTVQELAKFHALSAAYIIEYPEEFEACIRPSLYEQLMDEMYEKIRAPFEVMTTSCLSKTPEKYKGRLEKFIESSLRKEQFKKYFGISHNKILIHADFRPSNMLFKRQGGKVKYLVPVDYQSIHLGSPCIDLIYFIFASTDAEFRKRHMNLLIDLYYANFSGYLRKLNVDPDQVMSRKDFDEDFKDKLSFGLFTSVSLLPTLLAKGDNIPDTAVNGLAAFGDVKPDVAFSRRFEPVLEEYTKWGIL